MKLAVLLVCLSLIYVKSDTSPDLIVRRIAKAVRDLRQENNDLNDVNSKLLTSIAQLENISNKTLKDEAVCKACQSTVTTLINFRKSGAGRDQMIAYLNKLCNSFTDWGEEGCSGDINNNIDEILYIIDYAKKLTGERVCAIRLQTYECQDPNATNWEIPLPPEKKIISKKTVVGDKPLQVVHFTDMHYDPLYTPGSDATCPQPLCCENNASKLLLDPAGYWADYNVCDMPEHSVINLLEHLKSTYKNADMVYFTGDIISHRSWDTSVDKNSKTLREMYRLFAKYFAKIPVYPILGNHETHPVDLYSPLFNHNLSTEWLFNLISEEWSVWLPNSTISTLKKGGFYSLMIQPGLRLIALNNNVCFTSNLWLIYNDEDTYGQLKWLVQELTQAEKNGEKVHILSHVPPGHAQCHRQWSNQFKKIVQRFSKTISAQFNGHTHLDEFRVFFNESDSNQVINLAFNGGSFTTYVGVNPNYRYYEVNSTNFFVTDIFQYFYNVTKANENPNQSPSWEKLYTFSEVYQMPDLSYGNFGQLVKQMSQDEGFLKLYYKFYVKNSDFMLQKGCDSKCLKNLLCEIQAVETSQVFKC